MSAIYMLIFFSLIIAIGFVFAFYKSVKSGQYDDTDSPAVRMLLDDKPASKKDNSEVPGSSGDKHHKSI
jgi:cbb3-type cytochrome oxidase maturation protein